MGMLDDVAGHAQDSSRFACVAGLRTEVCLRSRACDRGPAALTKAAVAYDRVGPPA